MSTEFNDSIELLGKTHSWIDSLIVAGVSERAASAAIMVAVTERALRASGPERTAEWIEGQADLIRRFGEAWLKERNA